MTVAPPRPPRRALASVLSLAACLFLVAATIQSLPVDTGDEPVSAQAGPDLDENLVFRFGDDAPAWSFLYLAASLLAAALVLWGAHRPVLAFAGLVSAGAVWMDVRIGLAKVVSEDGAGLMVAAVLAGLHGLALGLAMWGLRPGVREPARHARLL